MSSKIYSSYWFKGIEDVKSFTLLDYHSIRSSITNFVKILTDRDDIKVDFYDGNLEGKVSDDSPLQSRLYKKITITASINKDNIDSVVGLTLHESSHIKLTDFEFLDKVLYKKYYNETDIENTYYLKGFKTIVNWVEDRRIDYHTITNISGYRGYYIKLYDYMFNNNSVKRLISKHKNPTDLNCWLFHIINMVSKYKDPNALPGLKELYSIIDLPNINRLNSTQDSFKLAEKIWSFIHPYLHLSQEDIYPIKEQIDMVNGVMEKKKMSYEHHKMLNSLDDLKIKKSKDSIFLKNLKLPKSEKEFLNNFILKHESFKLKNPLKEGISMGKKLASKLQFRNLDQKVVYHNQKKGKIDNKNLYKASFVEDFFKQDFIKKYKETHIHLSIDGSGSMQENLKNIKTIKLAACMATISCLIPNIRVSISVRKGPNTAVGHSLDQLMKDHGVTYIIFDSEKDSIKDINKLSHIKFEGLTPEGICFGDIKKYLGNSNQEKIIFMNISDGLPTKSHKFCVKELTKKRILEFKREGIDVLSYFVGDKNKNLKDLKTFQFMYGSTGEILDINNFSKVLKDLNKQLV
jgi:hypothetical protein